MYTFLVVFGLLFLLAGALLVVGLCLYIRSVDREDAEEFDTVMKGQSGALHGCVSDRVLVLV